MKLFGVLFFSLLFSSVFAKPISFETFQGIRSDPSFAKLIESEKGKWIMNSYPAGLPTTEEEFNKFKTSIAFWKLQRTAVFKKLVPQIATPSKKEKEIVEPEPTPKEKTERERYLEQFMDKTSEKKAEEKEVAPIEGSTSQKVVDVQEDEDQVEEQLQQIASDNQKILAMAAPNEKGEVDLEALKKAVGGAGTVVEGENSSLMENPHLVIAQLLAPYQTQTEEQIEKDLKEKSKGKVLEQVFHYVPQMPLFLARLFRSKDALPSVAKTLQDKKRLTIYFVLNVLTVVLGFIMKRVTAKELRLSKQFKNFLIRLFVLYTIRIFLIVFFFKEEFTPAAKIFMQTFF